MIIFVYMLFLYQVDLTKVAFVLRIYSVSNCPAEQSPGGDCEAGNIENPNSAIKV